MSFRDSWWRVLAVPVVGLALLWPTRLSGPLDGQPLDTLAKAVLFALLVPTLCWFDFGFLRTRRAFVLVAVLLAWKGFLAVSVVRDGWCVTVQPPRAYVPDGANVPPHSWDLRADWRHDPPSCTAIETRSYGQLSEFPLWSLNLPPAMSDLPAAEDLPPQVVTKMKVAGFLTTKIDGVFRLITSPAIHALVSVDDHPAGPTNAITLSAGSHAVVIDATLTGKRWQFDPTWNGAPVWSAVIATTAAPSMWDRAVRPWGAWITTALVAGLLLAWIASAWAMIGDTAVLGWSVLASMGVALATRGLDDARWHWMIAALALACVVPTPPRLRNVRGLMLLVGIPWLAFIVTLTAPQVGRFTWYQAGDDYWLFQRWAYRIFMQGYWLEGGEMTFWFQPLYRWIVGALHLVVGDSSLGEAYLDGFGLLVMAIFSFEITRVFAGFRWGVGAAVGTLTLFHTGPGWVFIGRGLSEITSAGFIYAAALLALRSRDGSIGYAVAAGLLALMGAYTRLNNMPMAMAVGLFAWPIDEPTATLWRPSQWFARCRFTTVGVLAGVIAVGVLLFALRTWHYTGFFSVFRGTALDPMRGGYSRRTWQPGMSFSQGLVAMYDSVMLVLETTEPPTFHTGAAPLIGAAVAALLAVCGVPWLRDLPAGAVLMLLAGLSGSLLAKGTAYPGRFSTHILAAASAVVMCTGARTLARLRAALA